MLLPSHKHKVALVEVVIIEVVRIERPLKVIAKRRKFTLSNEMNHFIDPYNTLISQSAQVTTYPVLPVDILVGVPFACQKWIFRRNNLSVKERGQHRVLGGETGDFEIATQVRVLLVDVLNNVHSKKHYSKSRLVS